VCGISWEIGKDRSGGQGKKIVGGMKGEGEEVGSVSVREMSTCRVY